MLGTVAYDTTNKFDDRAVNERLIVAYKKAYESYNAACDRYDRLVQAYKVLKVFKTEKGGDVDGSQAVELPYTAKIVKQMIEEAEKERTQIALHARECIKHLRQLKYKM